MKKHFYKTRHSYKLCGLVLALLLLTNFAFSQEKAGVIKGKITDETGPLIGATVVVFGTTIGAQTDANGNYSFNIAPGSYKLKASYVGFQSIEKNVTVVAGEPLTVNFSMTGVTQMDEVVVSYGKQSRRDITGSVATVDAKSLEDMPVMQFGQQLQGKVAGVNIMQSSGQPGRGISFRIRGAASLATGYQPLFVIDGMPITGSINNINPDEIESFTILKDASATSLYGSRAANGVILITTKHAKAGTSKIDFNANYGWQKLMQNRIPKTMNGTEWARFMQERFEDKVKYENFNPASIPAEYQGDVTRYGKGTDWHDLLTQTAPIQSYSLSLLSAREKSSSAVIAGYQEQEGVVINTGSKLISLRLNHDMTLADNKLKVGFNLAPSYRMDHNNRLPSDGIEGYYAKILESSPILGPYNEDGSYRIGAFSPGMTSYVNPLARVKESQDDYKTTRILGNAYANYTLVPGLVLKVNLGIDKGAETRNQYLPQVALNTSPNLSVRSTAISSSVDNYSYTGEAFVNYQKTLMEDHHLEALVGYAVQKFKEENNSISATGFPSDDVRYISAASEITSATSNMTQHSMLSEIGRLNYSYKRKYLLQGSVRRDGSSRFGSDRKYGWFPAVSAGWIVSEESFMESLKAVNFLKLRASYGITGNNDFGNFTAISSLSKYNYLLNGALVQGQTIGTLGNTELAWERNKQLDLGIDVELLDNRISFTYGYYRKMSDGLIQVRALPRASGFANIQFNIGQFEFWGHELSATTVNTTGSLKWTTNVNVSFERNLIKNLVDPGYIRRNTGILSDYYRNQIGRRLGEFYGFVHQGLYKDEEDLAKSAKYASGSTYSAVGTLKMKDINGDGKIDDVNDRTFIGDPTPDFTFGLTNNFSYKNFDLSITMAGQVGGDILAASKWAYLTNMDGSRVPLAAVADRWRSPENPGSGVYPRTLVNTTALGRSVNSQWIEDGTYLTAKNIALGYKFNLKNNRMLSNLRVYASVQQAFIITGYSGYNPEISLSGGDAATGLGVDENAYPVPRTFSIGFSSTFK
ncbi:TonB-dependent receptor [Chitinophaga alhagiae]|uniref:TonB-dependent receptor n=1 Tax=Chitinophaga alhagiae TaxID=2203219 RepID=A0ABM6WDK0_9BACT|nr:TonB-dependent receptor [Chitinophaga alhagiae]